MVISLAMTIIPRAGRIGRWSRTNHRIQIPPRLDWFLFRSDGETSVSAACSPPVCRDRCTCKRSWSVPKGSFRRACATFRQPEERRLPHHQSPSTIPGPRWSIARDFRSTYRRDPCSVCTSQPLGRRPFCGTEFLPKIEFHDPPCDPQVIVPLSCQKVDLATLTRLLFVH